MSGAFGAAFWGFVAGAPLLLGALVGYYVRIPRRLIGLVMALGAGVLFSSVAFELTQESYGEGGFDAASIGLLAGAVVLFAADLAVSRGGDRHRKRSGNEQSGGSGIAIAIGALMDGIPESAAIGISLLRGGGVSAALVAAVFLSNLE